MRKHLFMVSSSQYSVSEIFVLNLQFPVVHLFCYCCFELALFDFALVLSGFSVLCAFVHFGYFDPRVSLFSTFYICTVNIPARGVNGGVKKIKKSGCN